MEGERSRVMRQSVPKQHDKKSGDHEEEKGSGALKEEIGVWSSQGGERDKFFPPIFLSFSHIRCFFL